MLVKLPHRLRKAITNPERILPFFKDRIGALAYYIGDGTWAMNPGVIKLYVNNVCNARCIMCDIGTKNRESIFYKQVTQTGDNLFSSEDCRRLMKEIKNFKPQINIHGLEPLLHKDILDIIAIIKQHGLYIHLVSNGILLPQKASGLINLGVDLITVSLDGPEEIHDQIRGDGVFKRAIEGIRLLKYFREKSDQKNIKISTNFTINDLNYRSLNEYATMMLQREQVDFITFIHAYYVTEQSSEAHNRRFSSLGKSSPANIKVFDPKKIDPHILWGQLKQLRQKFNYNQVRFNTEFASKENLFTFYKHPEDPTSKTECKMPWKSSTVLANGDVIINNRCFSYTTGNIHESSFSDIWNGERYRVFRRELKKAGTFPACNRCCGIYSKG
jgi:MoaA/NifB/PqqE/SkfB family radical SAM enzyme